MLKTALFPSYHVCMLKTSPACLSCCYYYNHLFPSLSFGLFTGFLL